MSDRGLGRADEPSGHHDLKRRKAREEGNEFIHIAQVFAGEEPLPPDWSALLAKCESPIELKICRELSRSVGAIPLDEAYSFERIAELSERAPPGYFIAVYAQHQIDHYRADFLVVVYDRKSDRCVRIVLECDGHEFHQQNLDDQRRDRERDAYISARGYRVLRLSGKEIHAGHANLAVKIANLALLAR